MIINVSDLKSRRVDYVQFSIRFKNEGKIDKTIFVRSGINTHIPTGEDVYSYLIGRDENSIKNEEPSDVAEVVFAADSFTDSFTSRLHDKFTTVFVESSGHTCVELVTLFDILLHVTSNEYSSFILYDNEEREITETPRFVITK